MYQIKAKPEDFIVKEVMNLKVGNGDYAYFMLKKTDYNTVSALELLSGKFKIPLKSFGFAGNKDRHAVTEQHISIFRGKKEFENISINGIGLKHLGDGKEPVSLGTNEGNEFAITVRNLDIGEIKKIKNIAGNKPFVPNYFGPQRFSRNNELIGKYIVKGEFKKAAEVLSENNFLGVRVHLNANPNDCVGAIKTIPLKTRKIFVHSYQSFLFNRILYLFLKSLSNNNKNKSNNKISNFRNAKIPLIGFGLDMGNEAHCYSINENFNDEIKSIVKETMQIESIEPREFIIRQMPELSSEGVLRNAFFEVKDFRLSETGSDELNKGMKKAKIRFLLEKGCYATTALDFLLNDCSNIVKHLV